MLSNGIPTKGCTDLYFTCVVWMDIFVSSKKLRAFNLTHTSLADMTEEIIFGFYLQFFDI